MRGNPDEQIVTVDMARSIPACAGEPAVIFVTSAAWAVYPRVCGGTKMSVPTSARMGGLSPRVRGNRVLATIFAVPTGSIPACAGEPSVFRVGRHYQKVYPRVCGGTSPPPMTEAQIKGLSPRVRGNLGAARRRRACVRSIPACAGEPIETSKPSRPIKVYPRVCGGTAAPIYFLAAREGLSPRVRGNRPAAHCTDVQIRSIPACAGEPGRGSANAFDASVYPRVCGGTKHARPQ